MRRTAVAWAFVLPVLAGCGSVRSAVRPDGGLTDVRHELTTEYRRDAETAWNGLRARGPRAHSDEFRDGFVDGYADFCDRGPGCQPPPVPPVSYSKYKRFFGRRGPDLVNDYYAGFQHGADTAAGPRAHTAPPDMPTPRPFAEPKRGSDAPPPGGAVRAPQPKPDATAVKPDLSGNKFASVPLPPDPDRLPAPSVPLPIPSFDPPKVAEPPMPPRLPSVLDTIPPIPLPAPPK